jgi:outer membrane cobalamin receptor
MRECMERSLNMFNRNYSTRIAFAVAACVGGPAVAQDEIEETVVTATRTPVALDAVDAPVIVIT